VKTFMRRVERRMKVLQVTDVEAYVDLLQKDEGEIINLFRDLLIGVTSFFRDEDAFEALAKLVVPKLFEGKGASDTLRVWVPGCSTGEEAYSIAILLREHMDTLKVVPRVQVFATDIDEAALAVARSGRYPEAMMGGVSPTRRDRFFTGDGIFTPVKEIRDLCVFSAHSLIRDPPFSRIDLISCRNLLIYLGGGLHDQVFPVFHYALRPGGYLFLGNSENISHNSQLFAPVDQAQRVFRRRDGATAYPGAMLAASTGRLQRPRAGNRAVEATSQLSTRLIERRVLDRFAPPHVVVDGDGDVVSFSSRTGKFLEPPVGAPNRQLVTMARRGLRLELRAALADAIETQRTVTKPDLEVEFEGGVQHIRLTVEPLHEIETDPLYLVVFEEVGPPAPRNQGEARAEESVDQCDPVAALERELRATRERLQTTIEEYETSLEELKSANEELLSVNEEVQSTNEEMETSKEELQSLNEELHTVNLELAQKVDALDTANADLRNLFESTRIATIFLDRNMLIRSFTPAVTEVFRLIPSDRGRPITDIASRLDYEQLRRDIREVLDTVQPVERDVRRIDGDAHYLMRILPYRNGDDVVDGVLVTFLNVTSVIEAEEQQRLLVAELNHRVKNMLTVICRSPRRRCGGRDRWRNSASRSWGG
jgi:two-component system CheB/CheR fusion protein